MIEKKSYPSDLTDSEWKILGPLMPPRIYMKKHSTRELLNAIFYIVRSGCSWRMLPHDFPPWSTIYSYFDKLKAQGVWEAINLALVKQLRNKEGREDTPSAGVIDSQSVKTTEKGGDHGFDAGKKVNGRKRHILVDTLGLLVGVKVHPANIQDRDGAKLLLKPDLKERLPRLKLIWADGGYAGKLIDWVDESFGKVKLEIVRRCDDIKGFVVLPRRWVVERTFGWIGRYRRLSKDYEALTDTSECMIYAAMIRLMLKRLSVT